MRIDRLMTLISFLHFLDSHIRFFDLNYRKQGPAHRASTMSAAYEGARDCVHNHRVSVAAGIAVALPGTYLLMTGKSLGFTSESLANIPATLSAYASQYPLDTRLNLSLSKWTNSSAPAVVVRILEDTRENFLQRLTIVGDHLGLDAHRLLDERWASRVPISRLTSVALTTVLPGAFLVFARNYPRSWAARHQIRIANALHVFALISLGNQTISVQDLLITAFVILLFELMQMRIKPRKRERDNNYSKEIVASAARDPSTRTLCHDSRSVVETLLSQTHSALAQSSESSFSELQTPINKPRNMADDAEPIVMGVSNDEEMERLRKELAESKTAQKVKEWEAKRSKSELQKARDTLNEAYAEYAGLREEMKDMRQNLGREHQAVVYRKDIELFAMRKASEQKDSYIKDRESKLQDIYRSQKAVLELKEAQVNKLKERVSHLEQRNDNDESASDGESQSAVQVKLFRVRGSIDIERAVEEKDMEIAHLKLELSKAASAVETLDKTQEELRRAWEATFEAQNSLNEERRRHEETQERLRDATKKAEEDLKAGNPRSSSSSLPTIDEHDKKELEAMCKYSPSYGASIEIRVKCISRHFDSLVLHFTHPSFSPSC